LPYVLQIVEKNNLIPNITCETKEITENFENNKKGTAGNSAIGERDPKR
jgi:hypothetical protein